MNLIETTAVKCQQCQKDFIPTNRRGIKPKFCGNACKQKHHRASKKVETIQKITFSRNASPQAASKKTVEPVTKEKNRNTSSDRTMCGICCKKFDYVLVCVVEVLHGRQYMACNACFKIATAM